MALDYRVDTHDLQFRGGFGGRTHQTVLISIHLVLMAEKHEI